MPTKPDPYWCWLYVLPLVALAVGMMMLDCV